jgi:hypothetical protein
MRRRRQRWPFLLLLAGGVAAFSAFWYASNHSTRGTEPAFGGVYVEGVTGAPARINPLYARQNAVDESLSALVFSGLTRLDDLAQPFPDLAESWEISPDGRIYTFKLRAGVVWQDGRPFEADDVIFTLELTRAPGLRTPPPLAVLLTGAVITGWTLCGPPRLVRLRAHARVLSAGILQHLLGQVPASEVFDAAFNQRRLVPAPTAGGCLPRRAGRQRGAPLRPAVHAPGIGSSAIRRMMSALRRRCWRFPRGLGADDYAYIEVKDIRVSPQPGEVTHLYQPDRTLFGPARTAGFALRDRPGGLGRTEPVNQSLVAQSPLAPAPGPTEA